MSFKFMDFLLFPFFARLDECLEKGVHLRGEAYRRGGMLKGMPKTRDQKEGGNPGELS